jgi:type II secretory pathway component PulM
MSLPIDKEFVMQAGIALGACLGGWMFLVQPKAVEIHELDASIQELRREAAALSHLSVEPIAKTAPALRERSGEIEARGAFARDNSQLYGRIMDLAREHDVQVKNLRPSDQKEGKEKRLTVTRIDMTAEGEYERVADFFGALEEIGAYVRATSVQIAPTKRSGGSYTVIQLGFEVLEFHLPQVVLEMKRRAA